MKNQEQNSDTLIKVEGVSKKFCLSLKKSLWYGLQDMGRELTGRRHGVAGADQRLKAKDHRPILPSPDPQPSAFSPQPSASDTGLRPKEFWAVKDVSFELKRGECLGLIGRNGAGKTTLLKMLNGLIKPDAGRIEMRGRVGALISLGAGFNGILTGRENIYTNASVLGLTKKETDAKMDEIIDFAEIGDFIDTPVQNYSSGMTVRLGFAIASSLRPDILLLDEVLAVGDIGFMIKCLNRMKELVQTTALIFVSHNMQYVSSFCSRILLLDQGRTICNTASPAEGIDRFMSLFPSHKNVAGTGEAEIRDLRLTVGGKTWEDAEEAVFAQGSKLVISFELIVNKPGCRRVGIYGTLKDQGLDPIVALQETGSGDNLYDLSSNQTVVEIELDRVDLNAGRYSVALAISDPNTQQTMARIEGVGYFRVTANQVHWARTVRHSKIRLTPKLVSVDLQIAPMKDPRNLGGVAVSTPNGSAQYHGVSRCPSLVVEMNGPSGVGKTTLFKAIQADIGDAWYTRNCWANINLEAIDQIDLIQPEQKQLVRSILERTNAQVESRKLPRAKNEAMKSFFAKELWADCFFRAMKFNKGLLSDDGLTHNFGEVLLYFGAEKKADISWLLSNRSLVHLTASPDFIVRNLKDRSTRWPRALNDWAYWIGRRRIKEFVSRSIEQFHELNKFYSSLGCRVLTLNAEDGWEHNRQALLAYLMECKKTQPVDGHAIQFIDYLEFVQKAAQIGTGHWSSQPLEKRWDYHQRAINILKGIDLKYPSDVLEMGTMGVQLVKGSDTLDYAERWNYANKTPTYLHDGRAIPWPIPTKRYKVFVALRVFQYLVPHQQQAFEEAKRIADHVIIVVPRSKAYTPEGLEDAVGIKIEQFTEWNQGTPPSIHLETTVGDLYYWSHNTNAGVK